MDRRRPRRKRCGFCLRPQCRGIGPIGALLPHRRHPAHSSVNGLCFRWPVNTALPRDRSRQSSQCIWPKQGSGRKGCAGPRSRSISSCGFSWIFNGTHKNFVKTILRLAGEHAAIDVVKRPDGHAELRIRYCRRHRTHRRAHPARNSDRGGRSISPMLAIRRVTSRRARSCASQPGREDGARTSDPSRHQTVEGARRAAIHMFSTPSWLATSAA